MFQNQWYTDCKHGPHHPSLYIWLGGGVAFVYDEYHTHKNNQSVFKICIHSTIGLSSVNDNHLFPLCQFLLLATMVSQQIQRMKVPIDGNVKEVQSGEHNGKKNKTLIVPERSSLLTVRRRGCRFIGIRVKRWAITLVSKAHISKVSLYSII